MNKLQLRLDAELFFVSIIISVWFIIPFLSCFIIPLLVFFIPFRISTIKFLYFLISLSLGLIGYTAKSIGLHETDISRYSYLFESLTQIKSFNDFILIAVIEGGINPLFQGVNFLLAKAFPDTPQTLPFLWVTITYWFSFATYIVLTNFDKRTEKAQFILISLLVFTGIILFARTTESIKQCSSVAIMGYAIAKKIRGQKSRWPAVLSIGIHVSSVILLPIYWVIGKPFISRYKNILVSICILFSFIDIFKIFSLLPASIIGGDLSERLIDYAGYGLEASKRIYIQFLGYILIVLLLAYYYKRKPDDNLRKSLDCHIMAICILLLNRANDHNFIRYIYGYFPFVGIAYFQLLKLKKWGMNEFIGLNVVFILFFVYSNVSYLASFTDSATDYANSYVNNSLSNLLTYNVSDYIKYRVVLQ